MSAAAADLLDDLTRRGFRLESRGENLHIRAPKGTLTPELRAALVESKADLLAHLRAREAALLDRCRDACKGLALWPAELLAALDEPDKAAQLDGSEGPETLRAYAESLAGRLRADKLPEGLHEAYARLRRELEAHPELRYACETLNPDADPVLLAVAVRGAGFAALRMPREKYDAGRLIEIIHRGDEA